MAEGEIERTLSFVGKGLVYDTGGADLKVVVPGMSRDKGGAASVAGFIRGRLCISQKVKSRCLPLWYSTIGSD